jgi:hypothetical protein
MTCPAPTTFDHAVCACDDFAHVGVLHVKAGPAGVGSVGINGATNLVAYADTAGSWLTWGGFHAVGVSIGDSLVTPKDVTFTGDVKIKGDATIGGDLSSVGQLDVGGKLELGGHSNVLGPTTIAQRAPYQQLGGPPCNCDPSTFFDVQAAVGAARQAAAGRSSWSSIGRTELHLATGSYYVTSAEVIGQTSFIIDGNVSVFVDGSVAQVGDTKWKLSAGAQLDLFVSGDVASVGRLTAGSATAPDAFRLWVGGAGDVGLAGVGLTTFYGQVYAPKANVMYVGDAHVIGSIFSRSIFGVGVLTIDYGKAVSPPSSCTPPGDGGSGGGSGGGDGSPIF